MYCRYCGSKLKDNAMYCHNCGAAVERIQIREPYEPQPQPQQQQNTQPQLLPQTAAKSGNALAILGFVFAFLFPLTIAGLICSILGFVKAKKGASLGGLALAGIIISSVILFIWFCSFINNYTYSWFNFFYNL